MASEIHCGVKVADRTVVLSIQFPSAADAERHAAEIGKQLTEGHLCFEVEFDPMQGRA